MNYLLLSFLLFLSSPMMAAERSIELMAASCAACHGTWGHSVGDMPKLAGKDAAYLAEQLLQFKSGERDATVMHHHASGYSEEEIRLLADFFSQQ